MQVTQDATVPREWFVGIVREFLDAQRDHIRREDSAFYPAAERGLPAVDWAELDGGPACLPADPLFGRPANREYPSLLSDIKAWEAGEPHDSRPDRPRPKNRP